MKAVWDFYIGSTGYDLGPESFPPACISDCSASGSVDDAVDYWVKELSFDPPQEGTKAYLESVGAWDAEELSDTEQNKRRLLWLVCCDLKEEEG